MFVKRSLALASFGLLAHAALDASQLVTDPLTYGPEIELVHLYYDEFPTGTGDSSYYQALF